MALAKYASDHAVSAATVYLIRSIGTVWGVAISSAIVQTVLKDGLPYALGNIEHKAEVRTNCRHLYMSPVLIVTVSTSIKYGTP